MKKQKMKRSEAKVQKKGLITVLNPSAVISEQYRMVRTNIQFSMIDKSLKTLVCTSATAGEGKSTTVANLAVTFAKQGQKVLLVDADLRKPVLHKIMGVNNEFGLTHVITKMAALKATLAPHHKIDNLSILPAGAIPPNPSELLASKRMEALIEDLSMRFDLILFDTPPVLAVADARILGSLCDATLLVLKAREVERKKLLKAKELLDHANVNVIGTILNGVHPKELSHTGYYQ